MEGRSEKIDHWGVKWRMTPPRNVFSLQSKLTEVQDGQLHFQDKNNSVTLPTGFPIMGQFLSDLIGRKVSVLMVDGVAIQVRRMKRLVTTVKYPRDV